MKTLIAIIENSTDIKSTFGTLLSKKIGVPLSDLNSYRAKYGSDGSKAFTMLLIDIGLRETVILDHANASDALKLSKNFGKKIVFLPNNTNNFLIYGWLGQISKKPMLKTWYSGMVPPPDIKNKAELINEMNSDLILLEDQINRDNHWLWRIETSLEK